MSKIYGYDVYYRLKTASSILVAAHNEDEAREKALDTLYEMSTEELVDRFIAALDFEPEFEICFTDEVDELDEEEE